MHLLTLGQTVTNANPVLVKGTMSAISTKSKSHKAPDIFGCYTLEENVVHTFLLCAKGTGLIALTLTFTDVIFGENSFLKNQPHKDFNFQRN
jgi:hypothetical protein